MVLSDPRDQAVSVPSRRFPSSPQKPPPAKRITMAVESRQLRLIDGTDSVNPDIFRPLENPDVFGSFHPTPLRQRTTNENNSMDSAPPHSDIVPITKAVKTEPPKVLKSKPKSQFDDSRLPQYSYKKFRPSPKMLYCRDAEKANELIDSLKGPLGFDMEWRVSYRRGGPAYKTAVVQLSDKETILVIQLSAMQKFPPSLKSIVESPKILKLGANILNDGQKLFRDYGIRAQGLLELGTLALAADPEFPIKFPSRAIGNQTTRRHVDDNSKSENDAPASLNGSPTEHKDVAQGSDKDKSSETMTTRPRQCIVSLAGITATYTGKRLEKGPERCSNWEKQPLSDEQLEYAANDAHCAVRVYYRLVELAEAADRSVDVHSLTREVYGNNSTTTRVPEISSNNARVPSEKTPAPVPRQISRQDSNTSTSSTSGVATELEAMSIVTRTETKVQRVNQRPQHIRAYNLWHHNYVSLEELCATLRVQRLGEPTNGLPLKKGTVITYIVTALRVDPSLPFDREALKKMVSCDPDSMKRHKEWLDVMFPIEIKAVESDQLIESGSGVTHVDNGSEARHEQRNDTNIVDMTYVDLTEACRVRTKMHDNGVIEILD